MNFLILLSGFFGGSHIPLVEISHYSFTVDEKVWIYTMDYDMDQEVYRYFIDGDTIISDQQSKKLFSLGYWSADTATYEGSLYDVDRKTYVFRPGSADAELLYDFGLQIGDSFGTDDVVLVRDSLVSQSGRTYRNMYFSYNDVDMSGDAMPSTGVWVESVGCSGMFLTRSTYWSSWVRVVLSACYEHDVLIWEHSGDRENAGNSPGFQSSSQESSVYDLQGRQVGQSTKVTKYQGNSLPKGVYIQNGKKFVIK